MSPTNFGWVLGRAYGNIWSKPSPDAELNDAKEELKDVVLSKAVASKLAQTFLDSEVMQTAIT